MLATILNGLGVSLAVATLIGVDRGQIHRASGDALWAVSNFLIGASCVLSGSPFWACACAAVAAWCAFHWWHGGGGDGMRRRLKRWAGRFRGVRRTAPQGA